MRSLRIATIIAAGVLALASADAGAQHMGGARIGGMQGGGTRPGGPQGGGFHQGGLHGGVHGAIGPRVGTFPNHDGFPHGGFRHDGRFVHGVHGGHLGWWWVAGGIWTPWPADPAPVYAAPVYAAPVYAAPGYANVYYYCASAAAYYPSVTECPEGWMPVVPVTPAY